ncbi:MAG TPA: PhzF family phenazine biosynthesis isomerase, partial [Chryseosolibacter sp.]
MGKHVEVKILNAFVDNERGGNPAGVVLEGDHYTDNEKASIAEKVGLSETAFVSKSKIADFKLDFFTPNRRIADCGHATIATFSYLVQSGLLNGEVSSKEILDGRREIVLKGDMAFMEQLRPTYVSVGPRTRQFLDSLGLQQEHLPGSAPIEIVNTGNAFAIIPVKTLDDLRLVKPDFDAVSKMSDEFDLIGYYVFSEQTNTAGRDASTRMFAPRYGILEEAGTGMAAGP